MTLLKELSNFKESINDKHDDAPMFRMSLAHVRSRVESLQLAVSKKGPLYRSAENVGADTSYLDDVIKAMDKIDEDLMELAMYSNVGDQE